MGRGGGSSGGHRSGGGSFHYSGGGGHRGGGSSSRSSRSSYGGSFRPPRGGYYGGRTVVVGGRFGSTLSLIITLFIIAVVLIALVTSDSGIPKSTIARTKLPSSECRVIDEWYRDDVNWIANESKLMSGLRSFYNDTGVQPYLYITDNINGKAEPNESDFENELNRMYNQLFTDEGHVIVCFMESSPNVWATYYVAGEQARSVIDAEAGDILHARFAYYYTKEMDDEEFFSTVFSRTGRDIMTVDKSTKATMFKVVGVVVGLVIVLVIVVTMFAIAKKRKEQAAIDRDILNSNLEDTVRDPLEDKYNV